MPDRFIIRTPESDEEWEAVKKLLIDYRSEFEDQTCFTSFEAEMNRIQEYYTEPDKIKLIVVDLVENQIAGCVALRAFSPGIAEMKRMYVVPAYRGFKLGRLLAEAILEQATQRKYTTMILDTMLEMKAAQHLYTHLGFRAIPPYHHQDTSKVICFEKTLSA